MVPAVTVALCSVQLKCVHLSFMFSSIQDGTCGHLSFMFSSVQDGTCGHLTFMFSSRWYLRSPYLYVQFKMVPARVGSPCLLQSVSQTSRYCQLGCLWRLLTNTLLGLFLVMRFWMLNNYITLWSIYNHCVPFWIKSGRWTNVELSSLPVQILSLCLSVSVCDCLALSDSIYLSVSVSLFVCLSVCVFVCPCVCLRPCICGCVGMCAYLLNRLFIFLSGDPFIFLLNILLYLLIRSYVVVVLFLFSYFTLSPWIIFNKSTQRNLVHSLPYATTKMLIRLLHLFSCTQE